MSAPPNRIRVFYDGACPMCIGSVRRLLSGDAERLDIIDISAPDFQAQNHGLDDQALKNEIHVIVPGGEVLRGAPALIFLAEYKWPQKGAHFFKRSPFLSRMAHWCYFGIARILRPILKKIYAIGWRKK